MALLGSLPTLRAQTARMEIFAATFTYLDEMFRAGSPAAVRLKSAAAGANQRIELTGGAFALEQVYLTKARSDGFYESHRKYIDVQVVVEGDEVLELAEISRLTATQPFDTERDYFKYADYAGASRLRLGAGRRRSFFRWTAICPGCVPAGWQAWFARRWSRCPCRRDGRVARMNYRHHFHAGNFADVMKHALLVRLMVGLQKKEKGLLYLDTHAGRGSYDLTVAAQGDTLAREPEYPNGIGRLWTRKDLPEMLAGYVELVKKFDRERGGDGRTPGFYPGSPWIARLLARPQDRLVLCEKHPEEFELLDIALSREAKVSVQERDGYGALRAMLPPPEKRALVLMDPPFEAADEFVRMVTAVDEGLQRLPGGVFALWYPLTERARVEEFFDGLMALKLPPTLAMELEVVGVRSALKMKGCGLVVINPPWQFDREAGPMLEWLAEALAQEPGGGSRCRWLVAEK